MFEQCGDVYGWELLDLVLQPDHVELLIQLPPEMSTLLLWSFLRQTAPVYLLLNFRL